MRALQWLLIWALGSAVLIFGVARVAQSGESPAIRRACDGDVRHLCPKEWASHNSLAICNCMNARGGAFTVSLRCQAAWIKEHGLNKGECK
jgi:hypothetical protein